MVLGLGKKKEPTPKQIIKEERNARMTEEENRDINSEMQASGAIMFDFQAIEDEKILALFDSSKPEYCPLIQPLLPLFSRLNFLTAYNEIGLKDFSIAVDIAIAQIKNQARKREEYQLLENLRTYLHNRAYDSFMGFKVKALTVRKKEILTKESSPDQGGMFSGLMNK